MRRVMIAAAALTLFAVFGLAGAPRSVVAATGEATQVVDFETIFASLEADGTPKNVRLVDTLRVIGEQGENVTVTDPTSTEDFRVLSGFYSPEVGEGEVTYTIEDLDGQEEFVVASTPDVEPPVSMLVTYYLDGERVQPEDVVGQSGQVQMVFDVRNNTGEPQELTYEDANGDEQTFTEEVPVPMVAQLQMELPAENVTNIEAPDAEKVTDPRGDITVLWNLVMVPPIGGTVQSPEIVMDAEDFKLGAIRLTAVPVAPKDREFLEFAEEQFAEGQDSAGGLYEGATELSSSIDELHDGTLELLDGMERLFAGSQELTSGLGEAFSGSGELTSGLGKAHSGSGELTSGLGDAKEGSGKITDGLGDLKGGLKQIGGGLDLLGEGLPAGQAGAEDISEAADGIQQIAAGLATNLGTVAAGATQIQGGAGQIQAGAAGIQGIAASVGPPLQGASALCDLDPDCPAIVTAMLTAHACLVGASCGANPTISQIAASIGAGAGQIGAGAGAIVAGANAMAACLTGGGTPCSGNPSISAIAGLVEAGALELAAGVADALDGVGQLTAGVDEAFEGAGKLHAGSQELTDGLGDAVAGSSELTAGLSEAAGGSGLLTNGLGEAFSGSGKLSGGIGEAKDGAGQIEQGVYAVNELGVKEIARGANETAAELARSLALMKAQDERAAAESLTYGPPSSDQAETVIGGSGVVLTMDQLDNRTTESAARGIGAVVGFLALVGLGFLGARSLRRTPA